MSTPQSLQSIPASQRINALVSKHNSLENMIRNEEGRPLPSDFILKNLKLKKLRVKEKIETLRKVS